MKKLEYFETRSGQRTLLLYRRIQRQYFRILQEPKSKRISNDEIQEFQRTICGVLEGRKRRAYRSPVILELGFFLKQNNPPSIHKLTKNYLDLLGIPNPISRIRRSGLVYNDDKQVKILIANYHLGFPEMESAVHIKADTRANFLKDLDLIDRIKNARFSSDESNGHYGYSGEEATFGEYFEREEVKDVTLLQEQLAELQRDKDFIIENFGFDNFRVQEEFILQDIQKVFLKNSDLNLNDLLMLFGTEINVPKDNHKYVALIGALNQRSRGMAISDPFSLKMPEPPTKEGDTTVFKTEVSRILAAFKERYPLLFPLKVLLSVTVLYIPPEGQIVDLDNLALLIIPYINEIIEPPSTFVNTVNPALLKEGEWKNRFLTSFGKIPKMPRNSVTRYQVIELPRLEEDPTEGCVRIILGDGSYVTSLWGKVDEVIEDWDKSLDRF